MGFDVYYVAVFGIKSGTLLWGRVEALLMRLTATAFFRDLSPSSTSWMIRMPH